MNRFRTLPIGQVIGLGFTLVLTITLLIALLGYVLYTTSQQQKNTIQTRGSVASLTLELRLLSIQRTKTIDKYLELDDISFLSKYQTYQAAYIETYSRLADLINRHEEKKALQSVVNAEDNFDSKAQEVLRLYGDGFPTSARFLWNSEGLVAQDNLIQDIEKLSQIQGKASTEIINQANQREQFVFATVRMLMPIAFLAAIAISWFITRRINIPISHLVDTVAIIGFDLTARVKPAGPREISFLGETINNMATSLLVSKRELQRNKERMENELTLASQIQATLFPQVLPQLPGLELAALWKPAREMGGDFYTFIDLGDGQRGIAIGDASGKGAPAAMANTLAVGLLEAYALTLTTPDSLLNKLNGELCLRFQSNMNVACCYAILDETSTNMIVANAGCVYPYLLRDGKLEIIEVYGLPLGMWADFSYISNSCTLLPGDLFLFSSDGLVEAQGESGELFGFDRLEDELVNMPADISSQGAIDYLFDKVMSFTKTEELHDDLTMLVMKVVQQDKGNENV